MTTEAGYRIFFRKVQVLNLPFLRVYLGSILVLSEEVSLDWKIPCPLCDDFAVAHNSYLTNSGESCHSPAKPDDLLDRPLWLDWAG